jgi:hypothetical protein
MRAVVPNPARFEKAMAYALRIRNQLKREYARSYLLALEYGGLFPGRPEALGYMAAQAVRIHLQGFYPERDV